jgi:hypothetical protein
MPRQLPWLNKGGGGQTQVKQSPKPRAGTKASSHIDDDFFDGTVLAGSSKGKIMTVGNDEDSGNNLPDFSEEFLAPRSDSRTKDALRKQRAPSSSPPPIADHSQPQIEYMRKGASKFDLRDDEWMMVEDEFLETAKLFTRHLHIAEYEKLKERIEAKKNDQVMAARPVVPGGKMSIEGIMKKKAEVQEKRQRKAIRDVFTSQDDEDDDDTTVHHSNVRKAAPSITNRATSTPNRRPPIPPTAHDTDSDDLDAPRPSFKQPFAGQLATKPSLTNPTSSVSRPTEQRSALPAMPTNIPASVTPSFIKPTLFTPKHRVTVSQKSRASPFDMLDDYVPRAVPTNGREPSSTHLTSLVKSSTVPISKKEDVTDSWNSGLSKETAERISKRKAEREKERDGKRKDLKLEDIPTFLV